jgi:hypothetical protein
MVLVMGGAMQKGMAHQPLECSAVSGDARQTQGPRKETFLWDAFCTGAKESRIAAATYPPASG